MTDMLRAFRTAEFLVEQRRPLDALAALAPLLEAESDKPSVQLLAGRAYLGSAQLRRAEEAFRRVIELDPTDHYAHFALGRALQRQSRYVEARGAYRLATAMNSTPEYHEALSEVNARIALNEDPS